MTELHDILEYENRVTPIVVSAGNNYKARKAWGRQVSRRRATPQEETVLASGARKFALAAAAIYESSDFKLKSSSDSSSGKSKSRSKSRSKSKPTRSSKSTPTSKSGKGNPNDLSDAEIEQRREAARASAEKRRKGKTEEYRAQIKTLDLAGKVEFAAKLEREANELKKRLESELRATSDRARKAELRGELDDIRDMLSAKDDWIKKDREAALTVLDNAIEQVKAEKEAIKTSLDAKVSTLQNQTRSLQLRIQFAESEVEKIALRGEADELRQQTAQTRAELDTAINRAAGRTEQLRIERQRRVEAYRLATERLRSGRRRSTEYFL